MLNFQVFRETNPLGLCFQVACRWQTHHFSRSNWNTQFVDTACSTKVGQWNTQFVVTACPTKVGQLKTPRIFGCLRLPCAQTLGMRDFQITCRSQTHNFSCSNLNTQFVKYSISYQTFSLMKIITNCLDWTRIK